MALGLALFALALAVAVWGFVHSARQREQERDPEDRSGWIYFITTTGVEDAPVKVGMSHKNPCNGRLDDIRAMSPYPLRLLYKFQTEDRHEYEAKIHRILEPHRRHGEWYDRDATLMLIDHLKGAHDRYTQASEVPSVAPQGVAR